MIRRPALAIVATFVVGCGGSSTSLDNAGISPDQMESAIEALSEYCAEGAPESEQKEPYGAFTTLVAGVKQKPDVMVGTAPAWQRLAGVAADFRECDEKAYEDIIGADSGLEAGIDEPGGEGSEAGRPGREADVER